MLGQSQPALNASVVASLFPMPVQPDVFTCNLFYASPDAPTPEDCKIAWELLPSGSEPQPFSYHFNDDDPNRLPLSIAHGNCEIHFQTSGETARRLDPIVINATDVRDMAGWIIDECVSGHPHQYGGAMTKKVSNSVDWILDPNNPYFEDEMPPSATFYSLHIWNNDEDDEEWNPGDYDPTIGQEIAQYIGRAAENAPRGSPLRAELEARHKSIQLAAGVQGYEKKYTWWVGWALELASNSSVLTSFNVSKRPIVE